MPPSTYTAITFAPIQGFIEKSRKLRDLYGSSYILSALSWSICTAAEADHKVISPAAINVTQGMPNQIIIAGNFPKDEAKAAFDRFWRTLLYTCRDYIQTAIPADYKWEREWKLWAEHAWEFFHATGPDIPTARQRLNDVKQHRAWTGINWTGESSTLSGADGIAWPQLGFYNPKTASSQKQKDGIQTFYTALKEEFTESFIDPTEELSIPELVKRIITHEAVAKAVVRDLKKYNVAAPDEAKVEQLTAIAHQLNPDSFKDLNRLKRKNPATPNVKEHYTGWFLGDGDNAGDYLRNNPDKTHTFSAQMREWGRALIENSNAYADKNKDKSTANYLAGDGRMIYAGGDDFMGVLYKKEEQIEPSHCFKKMGQFNKELWQGSNLESSDSLTFKRDGNQPKPISVSVGFVWAAPHVPQRDVLQHCHAAEQSAKQNGRDRIAFRILFNGGNHLEWVCPWWILEANHIDISQNSLNLEEKQAWAHFYNDIATLESRHAFGAHQDSNTDIAKNIFSIYFGKNNPTLSPTHWWNTDTAQKSGLLGNKTRYQVTNPQHPDHATPLNQNRFVKKALNTWVINLAKVGFHLTRPLQT